MSDRMTAHLGFAPLATSHRSGAGVVPIRLSVILPVFNESRRITHSLDSVVDYAESHPGYRFLFVDDGSTDGTTETLHSRLAGRDDLGVAYLRLSRNRGKGMAIRAAVRLCTGKFICFTDGDLAYSLDHLPKLEVALASSPIVIGSRHLAAPDGKGKPTGRHLLSRTYNTFARLALGLPYRDTQAGLKGFRRDVAKHLFSCQRLSGFGFDEELLFLAAKFGYRVDEIPAEVEPTHTYKAIDARLLRTGLGMLFGVTGIVGNDRIGRYRARADVTASSGVE
jgi:glycosyltransferase involved in cell wall biosynthesis